MSNPHADPSVKADRVDKNDIVSCWCGDCIQKITAPRGKLQDAYNQHQLKCAAVRK